MRLKNKKSGFTLLEIIIVIIIVGVLASLALPRFFSTVEFSRSTEALMGLSALRDSMERCYLGVGGTYNGCTIAVLDVTNPGTSPGAHFAYSQSGAQTATAHTLVATRNTLDGGTAGGTISFLQAATGVTRVGTGAFVGIK